MSSCVKPTIRILLKIPRTAQDLIHIQLCLVILTTLIFVTREEVELPLIKS